MEEQAKKVVDYLLPMIKRQIMEASLNGKKALKSEWYDVEDPVIVEAYSQIQKNLQDGGYAVDVRKKPQSTKYRMRISWENMK